MADAHSAKRAVKGFLISHYHDHDGVVYPAPRCSAPTRALVDPVAGDGDDVFTNSQPECSLAVLGHVEDTLIIGTIRSEDLIYTPT